MGELGTAQSQKSYIYSETQPDRLIDCDGTSITYNAIGCPTVYDGYTTSWDRGKLSSLTIGSRFNIQYRYTFSYNALGQRIQKEFWHPILSSGNTAVMKGELTRCIRDYCYDESGRLISEHILSQCHQEDDSVDYLVYLYDGDMIIGVVHTAVPGATNTYYFERNLLGDVIAIYDTSGNRVGAYAYDAWGNCRIVENLQRITTLNPIRYRGYYYDQDTRLYYLNARYYCPEWHRFISPDDTSYLDPKTPNGLNLYAYCGNDPVNYCDPSGRLAITTTAIIVGALIGLVIGASSSVVAQLEEYNGDWSQINLWEVAFDGIFGAINGGLAASGINIWWSAGLGATLGFGFSVGKDYLFNDKKIDWNAAMKSFVVGALAGLIAGAGANNVKEGMHITKFVNSKTILNRTIANGTKSAIARQTHAMNVHAIQLLISGVKYMGANAFSLIYTVCTN